tara:strand:+ start:4148 stop:4909 length:762 start_codon:yes stop_codon:yes gene_type:complete
MRVLNERGLQQYRSFLEEVCEEGGVAPTHLLQDDGYSYSYPRHVELDPGIIFENKQDLGRYLSESFDRANVARHEVAKDRAVWASITLQYFDQFCPLLPDGTRKVPQEKQDPNERYPKFIPRIVEKGGELSLRGRRHYALGPYLIYEYNKNTHHRGDVLLSGALNAWGDDVEQTAGRIEVISNKNLIEVIRRLYWNEGEAVLRSGYSTASRPGNLLRLLADMRNQAKMTKDWYSMTPEQIYDSLPSEYDHWKH